MKPLLCSSGTVGLWDLAVNLTHWFWLPALNISVEWSFCSCWWSFWASTLNPQLMILQDHSLGHSRTFQSCQNSLGICHCSLITNEPSAKVPGHTGAPISMELYISCRGNSSILSIFSSPLPHLTQLPEKSPGPGSLGLLPGILMKKKRNLDNPLVFYKILLWRSSFTKKSKKTYTWEKADLWDSLSSEKSFAHFPTSINLEAKS